MRVIIRILFVLSLTVFGVACGGGGGGPTAAPVSTGSGGGGNTPPAKPPIACAGADTFPGFLYMVEATPTIPNEIRLSSTDGCRTESLGISDIRDPAFHMTADRSKGVIVWSEEPEERHRIVRRLDFTMDFSADPNGVFVLGPPVQILPLAGEEVPPGDGISYGSLDIWGDATHDSLYLAIRRDHHFGQVVGQGINEALVYDLNALTDTNASPDVREIYYENFLTWGGYPDWQDAVEPDCNDSEVVFFPQFVPSCYRPENFRFNPSGTRIYFQSKLFLMDGRREFAEMRLNIDWKGSSNPGDWDITGPEMVYLKTIEGAPSGNLPRPNSDVSVLPSPEYIAVVHRDGGSITEVVSILDADQCAADHAPYADGNLEGPPDLWQGCVDNSTFFTGTLPGRGDSWQSPEALLKSSFQDPEYDIHRVYVTGALAGTEQLVIETARFADSGN